MSLTRREKLDAMMLMIQHELSHYEFDEPPDANNPNPVVTALIPAELFDSVAEFRQEFTYKPITAEKYEGFHLVDDGDEPGL